MLLRAVSELREQAYDNPQRSKPRGKNDEFCLWGFESVLSAGN